MKILNKPVFVEQHYRTPDVDFNCPCVMIRFY